MRLPRRFPAAAVVLLAVVLASCGTRAPDSAFLSAGQVAGQQTTADGPGTVIDPVTGLPSSAPDTPGSVTTTTGPGGTVPGQGGSTAGPGGGPGGPNPTSGPSAGPGQPNYASDVGVTKDTIKIGQLFTRGGSFGPDAFTPASYGVKAYFADLNRRGGINGRRVVLAECDDKGSGSANVECARKLADQEKVFALVGTIAYDYDGASYLNGKGVPDVAGQPIGTHYDTYPHLFNMYGSPYPRDGKTVGWKNKLYGGSEAYRSYRLKYGIKKAAVVYYGIEASQRYGQAIADFLRTNEKLEVMVCEINFALPNYDRCVLDMKANGVTAVWDAIDGNGNANLCKAMEDNGYIPQVKASTIQTFTAEAGELFSESPECLNHVFVDHKSRPYFETGTASVKAFRDAMKRYFPGRESKMAQWTFEGWIGAHWFTEAATRCGAALTRRCLEAFFDTKKYTAGGMMVPRDFRKVNFDVEKNYSDCVGISRWQGGVRGGWVQVVDQDTNCLTTPYRAYSPT